MLKKSTTPPPPPKGYETVVTRVPLPKNLLTKLEQIAQAENKSLADKITSALKEHADGYEKVTKPATVSVWVKKKG